MIDHPCLGLFPTWEDDPDHYNTVCSRRMSNFLYIMSSSEYVKEVLSGLEWPILYSLIVNI